MAQELTELEERFQEWKQHPVTQQLIRWASQHRERLRNEWEEGGLDASLLQEYVVRNATAKGYCNAMKDLTELEAIDLENDSE